MKEPLMTVGQLISILNKLSPSLPIYLKDTSDPLGEVTIVQTENFLNDNRGYVVLKVRCR